MPFSLTSIFTFRLDIGDRILALFKGINSARYKIRCGSNLQGTPQALQGSCCCIALYIFPFKLPSCSCMDQLFPMPEFNIPLTGIKHQSVHMLCKFQSLWPYQLLQHWLPPAEVCQNASFLWPLLIRSRFHTDYNSPGGASRWPRQKSLAKFILHFKREMITPSVSYAHSYK